MGGELQGVRFQPWRTDSARDRVRNSENRKWVAWIRYFHWHVSSGDGTPTFMKSGTADSLGEAEVDLDHYLLSEGAVLLHKDGDDECPQATTGPEPRPRPEWLLGEEPDWAALADCWWGEPDAEVYEYDDCEEAIQEILAQMDEYPDELDLEAHRLAVLSDDEPELRPAWVAEAVIESLDEEYGWEDGPRPNGGLAAIQDAARVFCVAVRKHYVVSRVGDAVATVRVDVRKWVVTEDPVLAAELGLVGS